MLHSHHLVVVLYFLLLLTGTFVLGLGTPAQLEGFNRRARFGHMILGTLLLLTGGYLAVKSPLGFAPTALVKYAVLLAAVGLGVVGLRRRRLLLAIASLVLMGYTYGISKTDSLTLASGAEQVSAALHALPEGSAAADRGAAIYRTACVACHGADGRAGFLKSKDLTQAPPDSNYTLAVLQNGVKLMPAFDYLSPGERSDLLAYLATLRQPQ